MNHKRKFYQRVGSFLAGRGFYIVLLLCVATIGTSGYYLYRVSTNYSIDDLEPVSGTAQVTIPTGDSETAVTVPEEPQPELDAASAESEDVPGAGSTAPETQTQQPAEESAAESEPAAETTAPAEVTGMVWPISGDVVAAFSADTLTYNEALGDWRTHGGIDIACSLGAEVAAAANGTVAAVEQDALLGTTVTVNHTGGLETVYGNLDPDTVSVVTGDAVSTGAILGCVGSSATGETHTGAWLHFGVLQDGSAVDPAGYLS